MTDEIENHSANAPYDDMTLLEMARSGARLNNVTQDHILRAMARTIVRQQETINYLEEKIRRQAG